MEYMRTERAHLMCPCMQFGIVAIVAKAFDEARIRDSFSRLAAAHPFLQALLGHDAARNAYFYDIRGSSQIELRLNREEIAQADAAEIIAEYRRLTSYDWNLFEEGMLKASVWSMRGKTCFLLVFHHLLADGRGALGLAQELADCYADGSVPRPAQERLIVPEQDFPGGSELPLISSILTRSANRMWQKEAQQLSYGHYHQFANKFARENPAELSVTRIGTEELSGICELCHESHISVNDYLLAQMFVKERAEKIILAYDVRKLLRSYEDGALGNYATAISISLKASGSVTGTAQKVHDLVRKKTGSPKDLFLVLQCYARLEPGLLDAAFISSRGGFPSRAGRFIGTKFFGYGRPHSYCITNLGRIQSKTMEAAYFIPPASPAVKKIQGVLTVNGEMTICTRERHEPPAGEERRFH